MEKPCPKDCKCFVCEKGEEEARRFTQDAMGKYGWVAHMVTDDDSYPFSVNYHTHGLESYGHKDFQVCLPLNPEILHQIVTTLVDRVKKGEKFTAGQSVSNIIANYDVTFANATECDRSVLRIIFPDPKGVLDQKTADPKYQMQWEGTLEEDYHYKPRRILWDKPGDAT